MTTDDKVRQAGIQAIIDLQSLGDIVETPEVAAANWDQLSESEKEFTFFVHRNAFPEKYVGVEITEQEFPCMLYIYREDGYHEGYEVLENVDQLEAAQEKIV